MNKIYKLAKNKNEFRINKFRIYLIRKVIKIINNKNYPKYKNIYFK